jgi:K+-transporting ATPase ATPase A chain
MTANGWLQIGLFFVVLLAVTKPLGLFMARVFSGEKTFLDSLLRPVERLLYRTTGIDEKHEMDWKEYAIAMLLFSAVSMLVLYLIERTQQWLPFNPQRLASVPSALAFNTAASFTANTNWQNYGGESTMSYFTQTAGLAYHTGAASIPPPSKWRTHQSGRHAVRACPDVLRTFTTFSIAPYLRFTPSS